jgi:multisubunit Na+/H+ antiporter MnhF subunit
MTIIYTLCGIIVGAAILLGVYRMIQGPTVIDRIVAFDMIAISVVALTVLLSLQWHTPYFIELILIISSLGFFTTLAFVFYLDRSDVGLMDEGKREIEKSPGSGETKAEAGGQGDA